jgi:putative transposase
MMSTRGAYPTDVSDGQWEVLQRLLPTPKWRPGGPGRKPLDLRRVINGIFYVTKTGCQWRMMPTDFGNAHTIYGYFRRWRREGVWARVMDTLRRWERQRQGRLPEPSACCADSQSIKTATQDEEVGFDGHKKIKGRKRHILVDILGLIVAVIVTAANTDDRQGLVTLVQRYWTAGGKRLRKIWVDAGYEAQWLADWVRSLKQTHKMDLEVVKHTGTGFQVVKHLWKVERTFAWLANDRRHSRDYERLTVSSEAMIQISMIRILLKRVA